jgi:nucleotide-binding universal stress UspA family protein
MFGDVLVPLDGSAEAERALDIAIPIARYLDSTLRIVSWVDTEFVEQTLDDITAAVDAHSVEGLDLDIRVETATGRVATHLVDLLHETPGTLLCMTTHGRGRTELLTGSVASDVLREITSPALLVGPACTTTAFTIDGRILVPVDGSAVSESIVPVATAWAIVTHAPMELLSVMDPKMAGVAAATHGDVTESSYLHRLAETIAKDLGRSASYDVLHDKHPGRAILDHAKDPDVGVIAMATHGTTGLARLTVGSVTSEVVRSAHVPVLTLRPPHLPE